MQGYSKKQPNKIATLNDLLLARERFRYEAQLYEQAILSNIDRTRFILANNARQAVTRFGQRLILFSLIKYARKRFQKRKMQKEHKTKKEERQQVY